LGRPEIHLVPAVANSPPYIGQFSIEAGHIWLLIKGIVTGTSNIMIGNSSILKIDSIVADTLSINLDFVAVYPVYLIHSTISTLLQINGQPPAIQPVIIENSRIGSFDGRIWNVTLSNSNFTGPVKLATSGTEIQQCTFSFIQSSNPILSVSSSRNKSAHNWLSNSFINNTLTSDFITLIDLEVTPDTSFQLKGNTFSCNLTPGKTIARVLPVIPVDNFQISANTFGPFCPFECLAGTEPVLGGIVGCGICNPGWISPGGTAMCSPCPAGTRSVEVFYCQGCDAGTYSSAPNSTDCKSCNPGSYTPNLNSTSCSVCTSGTPAPNNLTCMACPPKMYSNVGLCKNCTLQDTTFSECFKQCGFWTTQESGCKDLSEDGIIVIAVSAAVVLAVIIVILVCCCCCQRKKEYRTLN